MSLKVYAILFKILGLAAILVPIFLKGMGYIASISPSLMFGLIAIGAVLLTIGNVLEAKTARYCSRFNRRRWRK